MKKGKRTIKRIKNKLYANKASAKVLAQVRYLTGYEDPEVDYNRTIQRFVSEDKRADRKYMKKLKKDILFSEMYYGMDAIEYFRYRFEDLSDKARKTYVGRREVVRALMKLETPEPRELFRDKYKTYKRFEKYYKRDIVKVGAEDKDIFLSFCEKRDGQAVCFPSGMGRPQGRAQDRRAARAGIPRDRRGGLLCRRGSAQSGV